MGTNNGRQNLNHSDTPGLFILLLCPWRSVREIAVRSKAMLRAVRLAVSMASFTSLSIQNQGCPRDMLQFLVSFSSF